MAKKRTKQEQAVRPATRQELLQILAMLSRDTFRRSRCQEIDEARAKLADFERSCATLVKLRNDVEQLAAKEARAVAFRTKEISDLRKLILFEGATPRVLARVSKLLPRP